MFGFSYYPTLFLFPLIMVNVLMFTPLQAGVLMLPGSLAMAVAMLTAGWLADRYDAKIIISAGVIIGFFGMYWQAGLNLQTSSLAIVLMLMLRGGNGITYPPLMKAVVVGLPREKVSMANSMVYLMMYIGGMFGIAVFSTFLEARTVVHGVGNGELFTHSSMAGQQSLSMLKGFFISLGNVSGQAESMSLAVIRGLFSKEALISAFDDSFLLLAYAYLALLVPTFLLSRSIAKK
jgi:MFS family permease